MVPGACLRQIVTPLTPRKVGMGERVDESPRQDNVFKAFSVAEIQPLKGDFSVRALLTV